MTFQNKLQGFPWFTSKGRLLIKSMEQNYPLVKPNTISVNVTAKCNSHCIYCDSWKSNQLPVEEPTIHDFENLYTTLRKLGVREISLSGGEPLLRQDLEDIIAIFRKRFKVVVTTNGMLLTKQRLDSLVKAGLQIICLSVDTFDAETYRQLRGVPFKFAEQAMESLVYGRKKYTRLQTALNCVITRYNVGHLEKYSQQFFKKIPKLGGINFQAYDRVWIGNQELIPSEEQAPILKQEIESLIAMKKAGYFILNSEDNLQGIPDFFYHRKTLDRSGCSSGFTAICINHDMTLHPCYLFPAVADLRQENLAEVWYSDKMRIQREKMIRGECAGCSCLLHKPAATKVTTGEYLKHLLFKR